MNVPCKDCPLKGCGLHHLECEKYSKFKEERDKELKKRKLHNEIFYYRRDYR